MIVIKVNYTTDAPIIKVNYDDAPIYISTTVDATYISVDYGSGAATNAVWGDITGTLSNQTDLQNALDDKVPYTGATGNVDLGEYELKAGQLTLDTSPTGTASVGTTRWNDTIGSSETTLKGGSVILKNGVDLVARVVNKVTPNTTLTKAAYQAVRISGAQGQRLAVAFAQANNDNNSADTIGLVTETIATNQEGFIMTVGNLEDINTTGSLQGETWADGDVLYLSPTVAGAITNIKPVAPQHLVVIGYVEYAHANHGKIYVKVMNGWELGELHDVDTTGATSGQVLKYNGTIWTPSSDLDTGITSLNGLTALTQTFATGTSGTDFNISSATSTHTFNLPTASATNRGLVSSSDWSTFNAKIGGTLATGQVAFGSAANTIAGSNNLFWDNTNGRLGIGTNAPLAPLHIVGNIIVTPNSSISFTTALGANTKIQFEDTGTIGNGLIYSVHNTGNDHKWFTGTGMRMRLYGATGNLLIQNGGTFTDGGQRLQVQGDAFIKGSGNTSGTTALTVQNSDGTNLMRVNNAGLIYLGTTISTYFFAGNRNGSPTTNGTGYDFYDGSGTLTGSFFHLSGVSFTITTGNANNIRSLRTFAPTSGAGTFSDIALNSTINQTGGANGITRGLYVNPTLTASADWRSIEWSNNSGWGLYGAGTSNNYLGGKLGLSTTDLTATATLRSKLPITGGTQRYNIILDNEVQSSVTSFAKYFTTIVSTQAASFNLSSLFHYTAEQGTFGAGSAISNQYGFVVGSTLIGATNNYGFYSDIPTGTGRWNLYMNGTANNYMAGSLGIGTTSFAGMNLRVSKAITGNGTGRSVYLSGDFQSDVSVGYGVQTSFGTQATTFTLSDLIHFQASQAIKGATSTIGTQIGYDVASLTNGNTNIAFRGQNVSASNVWNLYMNGTAANYLAGVLNIGTTTLSGYSLDVNGTARVQAQLTAQLSSNAGSNPNLLVETSNGDTAVLRIQNSEGNFRLTTNNNAHNITDGTTALSFNSGVVGMRIASGSGGISSDNNMLYVSGSKTASTAAARGIFVDTTLVAAANNDVLVGLDINPTFTNGAFTGVSNFGLRVGGTSGLSFDIPNTSLIVGNTTFTSGYNIQTATGIYAGGNLRFDTGIRDNRNNTIISQSLSSVISNRVLTIGNGTYANINFPNGNVLIGTTTDGGQKLQVNGDTLMKGTNTTFGTVALTIQNSAGSNLLRVLNNGMLRIGNTGNSPLIFPMTTTFSGEDLAGTNLSLYSYTAAQSASGGRFSFGGEIMTQTSGANYNMYLMGRVAPSSGTATFGDIYIQSQINQTGGANGITRGLYVNPTLTSAADWRSIETSNNSGWSYYGAGTANSYYGGHISIGTTSTGDWLNIAAGTTAKAQINLAASTAPTAPADGDIWFDGTDLKMRIGGVTKTFTLV